METPKETSSTSVISSWREHAPELELGGIIIMVALAILLVSAPMVTLVSGFVLANLVVVLAEWQGITLRDRDVLASFGFAIIASSLILVTVSAHTGEFPGFPIFYDLRWLQIVIIGFAVLIGVWLRSWWWVVIFTTVSTTAVLGLEFWYSLDAGRIQRLRNWQTMAPAHVYHGWDSQTIYQFGYVDIFALALAAASAIGLAAAVGTAIGTLVAPRSGSRQFVTWSIFIVAGIAGYSARNVDIFMPSSVFVVMASSFLCGILVRSQWSLALAPLAALAGGLAYQGLMIANSGVFQYWSELTCISRQFMDPANCSINDEAYIIKVTAAFAFVSVALGRFVRFLGGILLDMFRG